MAIYRPSRPRWPAIVLTAVLGSGLGFLAGWAVGGSDADPAEAVVLVRASLSDASALLEVAAIEYEQGIDGDANELAGAVDAVARSEDLYEEVEAAVVAISPAQAEAISNGYGSVEALMARSAPLGEVQAALGDLEGVLEGDL